MAATPEERPVLPFRSRAALARLKELPALQLLLAASATLAALVLGWSWLALLGGLLTLALSLWQLLPPLWVMLRSRLEEPATVQTLALLGLVLGVVAITIALGWWQPLVAVYRSGDWNAIGALGEGVIGAFGQILVAFVALVIAWRQFVVDQRLTTQQNRITQAQTIDSFMQGLSELISDEDGLLEDWPLERMLAEGRLAAVFGSIDGEGKAKILRFLAHARLLTPLRRDQRLGRAILDGDGNYEVDRLDGVPVIHLHQMLRGVDLSGVDLRGVDFNAADLGGVNLRGADLADANLAGVNLSGADLDGARLERTRFFYGTAEAASPADPRTQADFAVGAGTGAIVENANLSDLRQLDAETRLYLASWGGSRTRQSLSGSLKAIPSKLER
ncbi:pentapeptide repeat-containing protein [Synechococcus sp. 1G10]|uniref:pentapeptide repeat-containing protein n=1 Tax=Synechococcus sp. 1G10 TaxID=2025605 RepID=UPI000B99C832|nr:pentapeptide repeat-containing protein [Synechococcus sp. 1G10]